MDRPCTPNRIVLASASPRRRRLLAWLGFPFETTSVETPEDLDSPLAARPEQLAVHLAAEKLQAARAMKEHADAIVLCFDTIVVLDGAVLGKPDDVDDAWRMLRALSGRTHQVVTGCAFACATGPEHVFAVTTDVRMCELDDSAIEAWMASGEFMGCAGAYNIEGQVAEVADDECYQNVAGLPLCHVFAALTGSLPGMAPVDCCPERVESPRRACDAALGRTCRLAPRVIGPSDL